MIRTACIATTLLAGALLPVASAGAAVTINDRLSHIVNALREGSHFSQGNLSFKLDLPGGAKTLFTGIRGVRDFKDYDQLNDWFDQPTEPRSVFGGGSYTFTHSALGSYFNQPPQSPPFGGAPYKFTHSVLTSYFSPEPDSDESDGVYFMSAPREPGAEPEQVQLPIPEPASWAMMIGGFALVGALLRRRRAVLHAA